MQNVRKIRENVKNAEDALEGLNMDGLPQKERFDFWKLAQQSISNARALADMEQVRSKNQEIADDRLFVRRAVLELINCIEKDAMKIAL